MWGRLATGWQPAADWQSACLQRLQCRRNASVVCGLPHCGARSKTSPQPPATLRRGAASIYGQEKCARARVSSPLVARRAMTTGWHPNATYFAESRADPLVRAGHSGPALRPARFVACKGAKGRPGGRPRTRGSTLLSAKIPLFGNAASDLTYHPFPKKYRSTSPNLPPHACSL
jgi:hypothetical protein